MRKVSWPWTTHAAHSHALLELSAAPPLRALHTELKFSGNATPNLSTWPLTSKTLTETLAKATHVHNLDCFSGPLIQAAGKGWRASAYPA